jgi:hypothetical protein
MNGINFGISSHPAIPRRAGVLAIKLLLILGISNCRMVGQEKKTNTLSMDEQLETFASLGYQFNEGMDKNAILEEVRVDDPDIEDPENVFVEEPYARLYYYLGCSHGFPQKYITNNCIWYDLEYFDPSEEYITSWSAWGK